MVSADRRVVVTFNGEIYNFRELRTRLASEGVAFRGASDTEVLVHMIEDTALGQCEKLDGMFAFAAWNSRERKLILARDPFGKKPL